MSKHFHYNLGFMSGALLLAVVLTLDPPLFVIFLISLSWWFAIKLIYGD